MSSYFSNNCHIIKKYPHSKCVPHCISFPRRYGSPRCQRFRGQRVGSAAAAMVSILISSDITNIRFRTGWSSKEASRISDNVRKCQLDESSPVQKISELDWILNWLKTLPIILGLCAWKILHIFVFSDSCLCMYNLRSTYI
jgi:hypothetical protein